MVAIAGLNHNAMFEHMLNGARSCFNERGSHMPFVFGLKHGAPAAIIPVDMSGESEKDSAAELMRGLAASGADAVVLVVEAWRADFEEGEDPSEWIGRISEHPRRQEIVQVTYSTKGGDRIAWASIERPVEGKPYLGEWVRFGRGEGESSSGRFANCYEGLCEGR